MKLPTDKLRQVIRLIHDESNTNRVIGITAGVSPNTVKNVRDLLRFNHKNWDDLKALDNDTLDKMLWGETKKATIRKPQPDWPLIHEELKKRDVTLELLWDEYREVVRNGVSYAHFTRNYKAWLKRCKLSLRFVYQPGEMLFVDFCGKTMPIIDPDTGEISQAQIFVGTLGSSGYLFATAVPSQTIANWLQAHIRMLEHIDGVPRYIVPDNLKSAVTKNTPTSVQLNSAYIEFAEHYEFIILPARPRKPRDKSLAEVGVQIVQRWVLARLRHQSFFRIEELNQALAFWMEKLNARVTRTYTKSRMERFTEQDRPALRPLSHERYAYSQWRHQVRVDEFYHVRFGERHYSVPYTLTHQLVDLRANENQLDIYFQRRKVATHGIDKTSGFTTDPNHQPSHHQHHLLDTQDALLQWAQDVGPATETFVKRNFQERRDFANGLKGIRALRRTVRREAWTDRLEAACQYALERNILTFERLHSILKHERYKRTQPLVTTTPPHENLRGADYFSLPDGENEPC